MQTINQTNLQLEISSKMKTSFFAAVILGIATMQQAEAVSLQSHDFDFGDYELAEIGGEGQGDSTSEGDESASGVNLKIAGDSGDSSCCPKPKLPFDQQMLLALQELSGKSMTLYDALKAQFAKSSAL